MYIYYDKNYNLKEFITDVKAFQSASEVNSLYVYVEDLEDGDYTNATVRYKNYGTIDEKDKQINVSNEFNFDGTEEKEIPFNREQDLLYFKYGKTYKFIKFVIPDETLAENGVVLATIRLITNKTIQPLELLTFNVYNEVVAKDVDISLSQWNYLLKRLYISGKFIKVVEDIEILNNNFEDYNDRDVIFDEAGQNFYLILEINGVKTKRLLLTRSSENSVNTIIVRNDKGKAEIETPVKDEDGSKSIVNVEYVNKVVEDLTLRNDVVDIVGTYQELQSYDTSTLTANDVIKVLQDDTHDNASAYYKWNGTSFDFVGEEGPYYTQTQVDKKLDNKVNKREKSINWQVYGVGSKSVDLPNGDSIDVSDQAFADTLMNRNWRGTSQVENPTEDKDIANKEYVDITFNNVTTKVVQNNGIAKYIEKNINYNVNGAYARAFTHNKNIYILANNTFYLYSKNTLELTVLKNNLISETLDPNTTERVNEQPVEIPNTNSFLCAYRVKTSNGYEIRLRQFDYDGNNIGNYFTVATSTSWGLYEPFIVMVSATTGYIYYSKENNSVNQDIAMKKFTITNNTISVGGENIVVSGTNQKSDNGKVVANSRPGFSVITHLLDETYLMLIESNVNVNQTDNPYVIQYVYIKDLNDPTTYTTPKTLLKSNKQIINIPYITITSDGRIAISYHSTENYYGELGDGIGIHKKTFNAIISKNKIKYGQELNAYDFETIPTLATTKNQWSGGWGSIIFINQIYLLYVYGSNTATTSTQTNFSISTTETIDNILTKYDASVEVKNNSIMKRSSRGFSYTATPTNLDPTQQPTLVVNKAYVANYVFTKLDNLYFEHIITVKGTKAYAIIKKISKTKTAITSYQEMITLLGLQANEIYPCHSGYISGNNVTNCIMYDGEKMYMGWLAYADGGFKATDDVGFVSDLVKPL